MTDEAKAEAPVNESEAQPEQTVSGLVDMLMPQLLSINDDEVIIPLRVNRVDVDRVKAVKLREDELEGIKIFQTYLFERGFIGSDSWSSLILYCYNLTYHLHQQAFDNEEKSRKGSG